MNGPSHGTLVTYPQLGHSYAVNPGCAAVACATGPRQISFDKLFSEFKVSFVKTELIEWSIVSCPANPRCKIGSVGDYFDGEVISIVKPEGHAHHFECDAHDTYGLGIGFVAV